MQAAARVHAKAVSWASPPKACGPGGGGGKQGQAAPSTRAELASPLVYRVRPGAAPPAAGATRARAGASAPASRAQQQADADADHGAHDADADQAVAQHQVVALTGQRLRLPARGGRGRARGRGGGGVRGLCVQHGRGRRGYKAEMGAGMHALSGPASRQAGLLHLWPHPMARALPLPIPHPISNASHPPRARPPSRRPEVWEL